MLAWYDNVGGSFLFRMHMIAVAVGQAFLSSPVFFLFVSFSFFSLLDITLATDCSLLHHDLKRRCFS
jgi:hypothetical protein